MRARSWAIVLCALVSWGAAAKDDDEAERGAEKRHGVERDDPMARRRAVEFTDGVRGPEVSIELLRIAEEEAIKVGLRGRGFTAAARAAGTAWINLGPSAADFSNNGSLSLDKVDSGRIRSILVNPTDPNIVYVSFAGGGVWKTFDSKTPITDPSGGTPGTGPHWLPITEGIGSLSTGALAMNPLHSDSLVLGLGDPFAVKALVAQILHSEDGGATWTSTGVLSSLYPGGSTTFTATATKQIKFDPTGTGGLVLACTDAGLFKAANFGQGALNSWSLVDLDSAGAHKVQDCWSLEYVGGVWLAATVDQDGNGQLWRSTDGAANWASVTSQLPNASGSPSGLGRMTLASTGKDTSASAARVYLLAADAAMDKQKDVFISNNGGAAWTSLGAFAGSGIKPTNPTLDYDSNVPPHLTINVQNDLDVMHNQANYNQMIVVDPQDKTKLFIGGNLSLLRSTNSGATWSVMANWLPTAYVDQNNQNPMSADMYGHADWHAATIAYDGSTPILWGGNDGGLFRSTDIFTVPNPTGTNATAGCTWEDRVNRGLVTHLVYSIVSGAERPTGGACTVTSAGRDLIYGGLQDNGTRLRGGGTGAGSTSTPTTFNAVAGGDGFGVGAGCTGGGSYGSLLISTYVTNLSYSNDNGVTFNTSFDGSVDVPSGTLTLDGYYNFIMFVATDQADPAGGTFLVPATEASSGAGHLLLTKNVVAASPWLDATNGTLHQSGSTAAGPLQNPTWETAADGKHRGHYVLTTRAQETSLVPAVVWTATDGDQFNAGTGNSTANWFALPRVDVPLTHGRDQYLVMKTAAIDPGDATGNTIWAASNEPYTRIRPGGTGASGFENYTYQPVPATPGRVFRSGNARAGSSATWAAQGADGSGLPNVPVNVIKVDPGDSNTVYAGTEMGLYRGTYSGTATTWTRFGAGLPMVSVTDISVAADGSLVRVATYGRGFWEINTKTGGSIAGVPGNGDFDRNQQIDGFDLVHLASIDKTSSGDADYDAVGNLVGSLNAIDDSDVQALKLKLGGRP